MTYNEIKNLKDTFDSGISMDYYNISQDFEIQGRVLYFDEESVFVCIGSEEIEITLQDDNIGNFILKDK